jgi:hypothetical protein
LLKIYSGEAAIAAAPAEQPSRALEGSILEIASAAYVALALRFLNEFGTVAPHPLVND